MKQSVLEKLQEQSKERYRFAPVIEKPPEPIKIQDVVFYEAPPKKAPKRRFRNFKHLAMPQESREPILIPDKPKEFIRAKGDYNNIPSPFWIASEILKEQFKK